MRLSVIFLNILVLYGKAMYSQPNSQAGGLPLSSRPRLLFKISDIINRKCSLFAPSLWYRIRMK
jgi:hypothetical protein